jgi:perosamine synthetase
MKVSVNECKLLKKDIKNVSSVMKKGWYSSAGPVIPEFESLWANYCQRQYGIAFSSGTTGLIAALNSLGLKKGDEVILPNFTIISCGLAIQLTGATMVPVDCDSKTLNIDIDKLKLSITERTKAIVVVHIYGQPANMQEIMKISKDFKLKIIEDAAEAHGARYLTTNNTEKVWKRCGSEGDISVFSFYANKLISTGEGGMALVNDYDFATKLQSLRNLGFSENRSYKHEQFGFQFRMTSMQAALGIPQVERMKKILEKKKHIYERYHESLKDIKSLTFLKQEEWAKTCHWVTPIKINPDAFTVNQFRQILAKEGIETRPFFVGMHRQPIYANEKFFQSDEFSNSDEASNQGVILPSGISTSNMQIDYVLSKIRNILE